MKKIIKIGTLALTLISLVACQEGLSISSSIEPNSPSNSSKSTSSSSLISSSQSNSSFSKKNTYYPIGPDSNINLLSSDMVFSLNTPVITKEQAEDLVNNDLSKYPSEQSLHKKTCITSNKRESHVTKNRSTATYSVKDLIEEKYTIAQIDSDNKWYYSKNIENTATSYFVEDTLYRHLVRETLYFMRDGFFYQVHAEQSYYEGMENKGTYKAYYYKIPDENEDNIGYVTLHLESYVYFNNQLGLGKIDKTILTNFTQSSSFYYSPGYSDMERHPTYEFHSSGERGNFGCVVTDDYDYRASDLNDYPSMEKDELSTISYHQDYLLNNINYFTYNEDYLTKSISKSGIGVVIREETTKYRKKVIEECEVFYPDLSKFEEREYNPVTK